MYEDYHCLWYLLQSICMSCVCDNVRRWSMSFIYCYKVFVCPVFVIKCTKFITVFDICYKVFVCPVYVTKCGKMINVFDIYYKVFVCPVYMAKCSKMINVFYICYKVFFCPVHVMLHEDAQCFLYLLLSVSMSCVCNKM